MTLYLDASVVVPLLVVEASTPIVTAWLGRQDIRLSIGTFTVGECASAISRLRRKRQLSEEEAHRALTNLDAFVSNALALVEHVSADIVAASRLVRTPWPKLLMGDAIHVATCRRLGMTLVTGDVDLLQIGTREGIKVERPT